MPKQLEIDAKYAVYHRAPARRHQSPTDATKSFVLPAELDYLDAAGLSNEIREKLQSPSDLRYHRPGQTHRRASRLRRWPFLVAHVRAQESGGTRPTGGPEAGRPSAMRHAPNSDLKVIKNIYPPYPPPKFFNLLQPTQITRRRGALSSPPVSYETSERARRLRRALLLRTAAHHELDRALTDPERSGRGTSPTQLQLLPLAPGAKGWIDFGSGAGFPGLVAGRAVAGQHGVRGPSRGEH